MVANLPNHIRIGGVKISVSGTKIELWDQGSYREYSATADAWKVKIADEYGGNPCDGLWLGPAGWSDYARFDRPNPLVPPKG